jgi:hypothetical protein
MRQSFPSSSFSLLQKLKVVILAQPLSDWSNSGIHFPKFRKGRFGAITAQAGHAHNHIWSCDLVDSIHSPRPYHVISVMVSHVNRFLVIIFCISHICNNII